MMCAIMTGFDRQKTISQHRTPWWLVRDFLAASPILSEIGPPELDQPVQPCLAGGLKEDDIGLGLVEEGHSVKWRPGERACA